LAPGEPRRRRIDTPAQAGSTMPDYRYEVRQGDELIATGHLSREQPFEVGEGIVIGSNAGVVKAVQPVLHEIELRLVVQIEHQPRNI
jgi:hypothetical protein